MPEQKRTVKIRIIKSAKFEKKEMIAFAQFYKEYKEILKDMVIELNNDMTNQAQEYSVDFHAGLKEFYNYFKACYNTIYDDDDTIKKEIEEAGILEEDNLAHRDSF